MLKKVLFKVRRYDRASLVAKWTKKCPVCRKPLPPAKFWERRHNEIHREEWRDARKGYQCSCCKKRFRDLANYLRHYASHQQNLYLKKNSRASTRAKRAWTRNAHFENDQTGTARNGPHYLTQDEIIPPGTFTAYLLLMHQRLHSAGQQVM